MNDTKNLDDLAVERKRLLFRAWHRGTREMDLIMGTFAERHLAGFSPDELAQFAAVLEHGDPDLYDWITGKVAAPANLMSPVLEMLLRHRPAAAHED